MLRAVEQARRCLELLGRLRGELRNEVTINLVHTPDWVRFRTLLLDALSPYPEARAAVVRALTAHAGA